MSNGHKGDGDLEGELLEGNNDEGDRENGEGDHIAGKGQRPVLKGEPLGSRESHLARENQICLCLPSPF